MTETPFSYGNAPQSDFESQYRRIFEAAECRTQVELAEFLGIRQSSISDAKRRKTIPAEWLIKVFDKKGFAPDWIRTGMGDKKTHTALSINTTSTQNANKCNEIQKYSTDTLLIELARRIIHGVR